MAPAQKNDQNSQTWWVLYLTLGGLFLLLTLYLAGLSYQQPQHWDALKLRWFAWVMVSFFILVWLLGLSGQLGTAGLVLRQGSMGLGQRYARFCQRGGWALLLLWIAWLLLTWFQSPGSFFVPPLLALALAGLISYRWPGWVWGRLVLVNLSLVFLYFALVWYLWP